MTGLLDGAKNLLTRSTDLGDRLEGLAEATDAATGRLDDDLVGHARELVDRARARLKLSSEHTVVAIAGATGSGKSSTFNALTGVELSSVGVRRPTTSWATACVWGTEGAAELLRWLGIPDRHQTTRDSMLDTAHESSALDGVVLLDLPDHDSTEVTHHLEVDRLVQLADMLVWVLDPQKYADAAIHDRYLAPLRSHEGIMVVVLNHLDTVPESQRDDMLADVRRLLDRDGLAAVPVFGVSARQGWGIDELRTEIARRVADKKAATARLEADVLNSAESMVAASGEAEAHTLSAEPVDALETALADAAGVPTVVDAVRRTTTRQATQATGWPLVSWLSSLRPDPLKRLHLDLGAEGKILTGRARTSLPEATPVEHARVEAAVRELADDAAGGLTEPWRESIRRASLARSDDLDDRLDDAVGGVDLGVGRLPVWAGVVRVLQWLLILAALAGGVWTLLLGLSGTLGADATPKVAGIALPLVLLVGGVVVGIVLALMCRLLVSLTANARAANAERRLRSAVATVSHELVVAPVEAELTAYADVRAGLVRALG